jgi:hypothetical protein
MKAEAEVAAAVVSMPLAVEPRELRLRAHGGEVIDRMVVIEARQHLPRHGLAQGDKVIPA